MKFQNILLGALAVLCLAISAPAWSQEPSDSSFNVHVAQRGENLFRIALQYNLFVDDLAKANGITDVDSIAVGQRLIIPLAAATADQRQIHVVAAGETLASIATAYDITLDALMRLNGLSLSDALHVGEELIISDGAVQPEATPTSATVTRPAEALATARPVIVTEYPHAFARFGGPLAAFVHTVQAGETLSAIGLRYNQTVAQLVKANSIADPSLLRIGQRLTIPGIQLPRLTQALPALVDVFTVDPLVLEEGRTGRIELLTNAAVKVSGQFLGQELRVIERDEGRRHNILVGVPMFTKMAVYPLTFELHDHADTVHAVAANVQVIGGGYWRQTITIDDAELVAPAVEDSEITLLTGLAQGLNPDRYWENSLSLPAAAPMNAVFGTLRSYNGSPFDRYHRGVDFAGAPGTSVLAAADGIVVLVDRLHIRGNTIVIDHGWGLFTLYAHQQETLVQLGEAVTTGQVIGTVGSTGRSTGPHLHWEVWVNGVNVDPMQWVQEVFP